MAQDIPSSEIVVDYVNESGGKITITLDGEDFVLSASRAKPRPLVEQAQEYIGTVASSVWHHPTDVTIPIFLAPVLAGVFNPIAPQAQRNALAIMRIAVGSLSVVYNDPKHLRLALQMLLVYQQTDLRGRMLLAAGTRLGTSMTLSKWVFSFGGRLKPKSRAGKIGAGLGMFFLASIGSTYRVSRNIYERNPHNAMPNVYSALAAITTGEDRIIDLPQEIGIDAYFKIRTYLIENPDAIQLADAELILIQKAINAVFDFISDPRGFVSQNAND